MAGNLPAVFVLPERCIDIPMKIYTETHGRRAPVRFLVGLAITLVAAMFMVLTNPTQDQFHTYYRGELEKAAVHGGYGGAVEAAKRVQAWTGFDAVGRLTKAVLIDATRKDYLLFSTYEIVQNGERSVWIGVFKQFIRVSR
jgi:hypothetical protein